MKRNLRRGNVSSLIHKMKNVFFLVHRIKAAPSVGAALILAYCLLKHMFLIFYVIFVSLILFVFIIHLVSNHHIYLAGFFGRDSKT